MTLALNTKDVKLFGVDAALLYGVIVRNTNAHKVSKLFISISELSRVSGLSLFRVRNALQVLQKEGLIIATKLTKRSRYFISLPNLNLDYLTEEK